MARKPNSPKSSCRSAMSALSQEGSDAEPRETLLATPPVARCRRVAVVAASAGFAVGLLFLAWVALDRRSLHLHLSAVLAAYEDQRLLLPGNWSYSAGVYSVEQDSEGAWSFTEVIPGHGAVSGSLKPEGSWWQAELSSPAGDREWGSIRLRRGEGETLVSNFLPEGSEDWSEAQDVVAQRVGTNFFVFLEVFRLVGTRWMLGGLYHSQLLVCPASALSEEERRYVRTLSTESKGYAELPEHWWRQSHAKCVVVSFGGSHSKSACSGVGRRTQYLSECEAMIPNVDQGVAWKYYYGIGSLSALDALQRVCSQSCGQHWSGSAYDMVGHNCNTFTSSILHCVYGLSQKKPNLGVSDMKWANCKC